MENLDIKSLTKELKQGMQENKNTAKTRRKTDRQEEKFSTSKSFKDLIEEVNLLTDYDTKGCIYIDGQIHDLLRQLKMRTKLRIGPLISMLLEKLISDHKEEITRILKHKPNRFIDS